MKKKYFMKGTDDELVFEDMIELEFVGEEDGVKKHTHLEMKFLPEYVDELLEEEIIEEREVKEEENNNLINFQDDNDTCPCGYGGLLDDLSGDVEELDDEVAALKRKILNLEKRIEAFEGNKESKKKK